MGKKYSVTIKVDERLLREARHEAVNNDQSLTAWVASLIEDHLSAHKGFRSASTKIIKSMQVARTAGGERFDRNSLYEERLRR